jgi:hypothetical protein
MAKDDLSDVWPELNELDRGVLSAGRTLVAMMRRNRLLTAEALSQWGDEWMCANDAIHDPEAALFALYALLLQEVPEHTNFTVAESLAYTIEGCIIASRFAPGAWEQFVTRFYDEHGRPKEDEFSPEQIAAGWLLCTKAGRIGQEANRESPN